ncbi:MAG: sulfurtransferase [Alphaproteobacteria bacterium]|nr:sulfurtransferase [Alphaproteobacteria bacterium]
MTQSALISASDLQKIMTATTTKIIDASYSLPPLPVRIAEARDFDIDDIADPAAPLSHTVPSADVFAQKVSALGISNGDTVIIYDRAGMHMAAARAWWMFRLFGHDNVRILNGGLPAWVGAGLPVTPKPDSLPPAVAGNFTAAFNPALLKLQGDILENITAKTFTLLDARDARRYSGDMAEPRPGMQSGHVPGSYSMPFPEFVNDDSGLLRSPAEIKAILAEKNIDLTRPAACTCGSGVTACVVALALHEIGHTDAAVYDGSWSEWGADENLPKKQGYTP